MSHTYKIMIRQTTPIELATLTIDDPATLDDHVREALKDAHDSGRLNKLATRVGLPAVAVSEISSAEGSDELISMRLYDPAGTSLAERSFTVKAASGNFIAAAHIDEQEVLIGVFNSKDVADQIGTLWKNGHIQLA